MSFASWLEKAFQLSPCEVAVWNTLKAHIILAQIDGSNKDGTFSSDTLRELGLEKALYGDTQQSVGLFFFKVKRLGLAVEVGRTRSTIASNHHREIRVYKIAEAMP